MIHFSLWIWLSFQTGCWSNSHFNQQSWQGDHIQGIHVHVRHVTAKPSCSHVILFSSIYLFTIIIIIIIICFY